MRSAHPDAVQHTRLYTLALSLIDATKGGYFLGAVVILQFHCSPSILLRSSPLTLLTGQTQTMSQTSPMRAKI